MSTFEAIEYVDMQRASERYNLYCCAVCVIGAAFLVMY